MKTLFAIILLTLSTGVLAQNPSFQQAQELYNNLTICELYYQDEFIAAMNQYGANQPSEERDHSLEMMNFFEGRALQVLMKNGPHIGNELDSSIWHDVVGKKNIREITRGFTDNQVGQLPTLCSALREQVKVSSQS